MGKIVRGLWIWTVIMMLIAWPVGMPSLIITVILSVASGNAEKAKGDDSIESCVEYLKEKYYYKKKD